MRKFVLSTWLLCLFVGFQGMAVEDEPEVEIVKFGNQTNTLVLMAKKNEKQAKQFVKKLESSSSPILLSLNNFGDHFVLVEAVSHLKARNGFYTMVLHFHPNVRAGAGTARLKLDGKFMSLGLSLVSDDDLE